MLSGLVATLCFTEQEPRAGDLGSALGVSPGCRTVVTHSHMRTHREPNIVLRKRCTVCNTFTLTTVHYRVHSHKHLRSVLNLTLKLMTAFNEHIFIHLNSNAGFCFHCHWSKLQTNPPKARENVKKEIMHRHPEITESLGHKDRHRMDTRLTVWLDFFFLHPLTSVPSRLSS